MPQSLRIIKDTRESPLILFRQYLLKEIRESEIVRNQMSKVGEDLEEGTLGYSGYQISSRLAKRQEKLRRYCYNLDLENAKLYFLKSKETMMEMMERTMECANTACVVHTLDDDEIDCEVSKNEGSLLALGEEMKRWDSYGNKLIKTVEMLKF
jgi:hypothetical protein